jgi:hypothetical protein
METITVPFIKQLLPPRFGPQSRNYIRTPFLKGRGRWDIGLINFGKEPRPHVLYFGIGFICHLSFYEIAGCGSLQSIKKVVLVEGIESFVETLL